MWLVPPEREGPRHTGPEAQALEERLASLRYKIRATAAYERFATSDEVGAGGAFRGKLVAVTEVHRRALLREWLSVACFNMRLHLDAALLKRVMPPKWDEAQDLERRMACVAHQFFATDSDRRFHMEHDSLLQQGGGFEEEKEFLALAKDASKYLVQEWLRLSSLMMDMSSSSSSDSMMPTPTWQEEDRRPTWQEAQALQIRLSSLFQQREAAAANIRMAKWLLAQGLVADGTMILGRSQERHLSSVRAWRQLASTAREPDFSAMSEADRAAEAERLRQEKLQEARRLLCEAGDIYRSRVLEAKARILDFDPKQMDGIYFNSVSCVNLAVFDHTMESPFGPMRFTDRVYKDNDDMAAKVGSAAVNILSVEIASSDIGFPIQLYGTVVARDCIDRKRVYLFQRDSDHCQLINSKEEALMLTGPKRGLLLLDDDFVETDLWVKDHQGHCREFSKGHSAIRGIAGRPRGKQICVDERVSLHTRLSTVDVLYQVVGCAVEATIAVEVLLGEFDGVITAHTTSSESCILLYDSSKVAGGNCHGVIQLMRAAVSVYVKDELMILAKTTAGDVKDIKSTPKVNGGDEIVFTLGDATMCVKVAWSMILFDLW